MLTIVTPPASKLLTTPDAAAAELGIAADEPRLPSLIAQASGICARYAGRVFGRGTYTETPDGCTSPMVLSRTPVVSSTFVSRGSTVLDPSAYALDMDAGLLDLHGCYSWAGWRALSVTYVAGYVLPGDTGTRDLPDDVERACLECIKALWFSGGSGARDPALRSESIEGIGSTSWLDPQAASGGLPVLAATLLGPYRTVRL